MRLAALVLLRLTIRPYHCCLSPQSLLHLHPPQQRQWYCPDNKGIPRCYWPPPPLHRPHRMICSLPGRNGNQSPLVWLCVGLELSSPPLGIIAILLVGKKVSFDVVSGGILWRNQGYWWRWSRLSLMGYDWLLDWSNWMELSIRRYFGRWVWEIFLAWFEFCLPIIWRFPYTHKKWLKFNRERNDELEVLSVDGLSSVHSFGRLIDWLIDWLIGRLIDWLID